jgi:hypothetical protein
MDAMSAAPYQTAVLSRGRHRSPKHGVCAMELSSMLGEERFTDHPQRVCPAVAAFLRGYNDALSARLRQELFGIAAVVVGSRTADEDVRRERHVALLRHAFDVWSTRRFRGFSPPAFPPENAFGDLEAAGAYVGRAARRDRAVHERTVAFVEALVGGRAAGLADGDGRASVRGHERRREPTAC